MKVTPSQAQEFYRPKPAIAEPKGPVDLDPKLDWKDGSTPISGRFGDVYFSRVDGLAEARHVFLEGAGLPDAWRGRKMFVIGETGFGTGLTFVATWKLWRGTAGPDARLHYLSVEGYPLTADHLLASLAPWPELEPFAQELASVYPPPHAGFHRVWLDGGRVALTLMVGPVAAVLGETEARVDAWFLDGFAPSRNPEMWSPEVVAEIARLSVSGARIATFSAASPVRRALRRAGFSVDKRPGFAAKREMLVGRFNGSAAPSALPPWYRPPDPVGENARVVVIGSGIAGCAVAGALARRGRTALMVDPHDGVAAEASGNPGALIAPQLGLADSASNSFYDRAYRMVLASIGETGSPWDGRGALRIHPPDEARRRVGSVVARAALWSGAAVHLPAGDVAHQAGIDMGSDAAWCPEAGLVDPAEFAGRLAGPAERVTGRVSDLTAIGDQGWRVSDAEGRLIGEADCVVVAAAHGSLRVAAASWLPLGAVLGQISGAPATEASANLRTAVLSDGYIAPARGGRHLLGATYARDGFDPTAWPQPVTIAGHRRVFDGLPDGLRRVLPDPDTGTWWGRAALRCATPDRLPAVGPLAMDDHFTRDFSALRHGPRGRFPPAPAYHRGLYVLAGLGSRGIMTATLSAEILVCQMLGEPWPVERRVALALTPARFLARQLRQSAGRSNPGGST